MVERWGQYPREWVDQESTCDARIFHCIGSYNLLTMWNDTDIPLGYLITFRCYGTWLHGDRRGSIDRFHNRYKSPYLPRSDRRHTLNRHKLKSPPFLLGPRERVTVKKAIREVCNYHRWHLHASNVRTNHVHVLVSIGKEIPGKALNSLKSIATRRLRQGGSWRYAHSPWADKGSCIHLWNEQSLVSAVNYVLNDQGDDLPAWG